MAYSRLRTILEKKKLTVIGLHQLLAERGHKVDVKSLYRLTDETRPIERLNARVLESVCLTIHVGLADLIEFTPPKLERFPAAKQNRMDELMELNNEGKLTAAQRRELEALVEEAEVLTLANARVLAQRRHDLKPRRPASRKR